MEPEVNPVSPEPELPSLSQQSQKGHWLSWIFLGDEGLRAGWSISIFLALTAIFTVVTGMVLHAAHLVGKGGFAPATAFWGELGGVVAIAAAASIVALIEGRGSLMAYNLRGPKRVARFAIGLGSGFAALALLVGLLSIGGWIHFGAITLSAGEICRFGLIWGAAFLLVGLFEEGTFRCYLQSTLERGLNFWTAVGLVAALCVGELAIQIRVPGEHGSLGVYLMALLGLGPCFLIWRQERLYAHLDEGGCGGECGCGHDDEEHDHDHDHEQEQVAEPESGEWDENPGHGDCCGCSDDEAEEGCCGGQCECDGNCDCDGNCECDGSCAGCEGDCGCGDGCEEDGVRPGFWYAAWFLSTLFGFVHTPNVGENWIGIFSAALIGFVFVVSIRLTGSAWWAIGFHAAWDWAETFFFGTADSGNVAVGHFLTTSPAGNATLSGGSAGPEGSIFCIVVIVVTLVAMIFAYGKVEDSAEGCCGGCGCSEA